MKYLGQITIIMTITFIGEVMKSIIPLPVPSSIYGLLILLFLLLSKKMKIDQVKTTGNFFIQTMPIMFIPAAVGIINTWGEVRPLFLPLILTIFVTTVIVMVISGRLTEVLMSLDKKEVEEFKNIELVPNDDEVDGILNTDEEIFKKSKTLHSSKCIGTEENINPLNTIERQI